MEIFNRDIYPSEQFIAAYPELEFFTGNPPIARAFASAEATAVFWKRWYSWLGITSLALVAVVMFALALRVTVAATWAPACLAWLVGLGEVLGVMALLAQGSMLVVRMKERWILARFHAERLRCLKFQAFAFLATATSFEEAGREAKGFTDQAIANLSQELMGGRAAMLQFSPLENIRALFGQLRRSRGREFQRAAFAYERLRLEAQLQHFESRAHQSREADRLPSTAADLAFVVGAVIAVLAPPISALVRSLASAADAHDYETNVAPWVSLTTLLAFILSAVLAIYQRGAASKANAERDARYAREIGRILSRQPPTSAAGFAETVREMETIAMQELEEYSRGAEMASYLF